MKLSVFLFVLLLSISISAQDEPSDTDPAIIVPDSELVVVAPVTSLIAEDHKYDKGDHIDLSWVPSIDDQLLDGTVIGYKLYRSANGGEPVLVEEFPPGTNAFTDDGVYSDSTYSYFIAALSENYAAESNRTAPIAPEVEWLNLHRGWLFLIALIVGGSVLLFINAAKRGTKLFVRKIAGLEAVDDAVGRATEMGRPILFIPGIRDMDDVQTLAGLTILGRVARVIADYDTRIFMPTSRSLVMTAGRETVKAAYTAAGRPDKYNDDMVTYYTDEQFGYVAAVDGVMVREKPATVFLLGAFFAESLILAETGNSIGAIQIAGTARPAQLPFFIAACDFTLIGEELFAASAYLSGEPMQLGSLKGQDVGKAIAMLAILVGVFSATVGLAWDIEFFNDIVEYLSDVFSAR
ncbi:MAG: fibronectin type III domain-containing protein [Candidatus Zixiibacteriota bacterium]|nr:MAG: fibronectin type III domain-containing protein [candidate division Zixibacteria bacterium]